MRGPQQTPKTKRSGSAGKPHHPLRRPRPRHAVLLHAHYVILVVKVAALGGSRLGSVGSVRLGLVGFGWVRLGSVGFGWVRFGWVWLGSVCVLAQPSNHHQAGLQPILLNPTPTPLSPSSSSYHAPWPARACRRPRPCPCASGGLDRGLHNAFGVRQFVNASTPRPRPLSPEQDQSLATQYLHTPQRPTPCAAATHRHPLLVPLGAPRRLCVVGGRPRGFPRLSLRRLGRQPRHLEVGLRLGLDLHVADQPLGLGRFCFFGAVR
jgi:hypothetical protein